MPTKALFPELKAQLVDLNDPEASFGCWDPLSLMLLRAWTTGGALSLGCILGFLLPLTLLFSGSGTEPGAKEMRREVQLFSLPSFLLSTLSSP